MGLVRMCHRRVSKSSRCSKWIGVKGTSEKLRAYPVCLLADKNSQAYCSALSIGANLSAEKFPDALFYGVSRVLLS